MCKVSVIIPCYNMEQFLPQCLDSLCSQTLSDAEFICVNDGSTDTTLSILRAYAEKDARFVIIDQTNHGAAASRNTALERAQGEFVICMDPDDYYPDPGVLELLYTKAIENGALICGGSFSYHHHIKKVITTVFRDDFIKYTFTAEGFISFDEYQYDYGYHRFLYSRKLLTENGINFPLYKRFQDPVFFVRAMLAAKRFYAVPNVVYRYRVESQAAPSSWPLPAVHDLLKGLYDNLTLASRYHLCELHALTVRRLEDNFHFIPTMNAFQRGDPQTVSLLCRFAAAIDPALIEESGMALAAPGCYVLRHFQAIAQENSRLDAEQKALQMRLQAVQAKAKADLACVYHSNSYRIGRSVTCFPRKLRSAWRLLKSQGMSNTLEYGIKKLLRK